MSLCYFTGQHPDAGEGVTDRFATTTLVMGAEGIEVCDDHAAQYKGFNPHGETTSDGTLIVPGLRVLDYNRNPGTVIEDRDGTEYRCEALNLDLASYHPCHNGWTKPTHWFTVLGDANESGAQHGGGMFDGSRMEAIR